MDPTTGDTRPPGISGTVITIVTGLAYAMAFAFEAGNAGAFGIPFEMIDLQLIPAIFGIVVTLGILFGLLQLIDGLIPLLRRKPNDHPVLSELKPTVFLLMYGTVLWILARPLSWSWIAAYLALAISYPVVNFAKALFQVDAKGFIAKLRRYQETRKPSHGPLMTTFRSDRRVFVKTSLSLMLVIASATAGYGRGHRQQDFFVTNLEPETVVLRIYGNRAVTAEFVRTEKRIKPVYRFVRLDEPGLTLRLERIGPITFTEGDPPKHFSILVDRD